MSRMARWLANTMMTRRLVKGRGLGLHVEALEARTTPASLVTIGLPAGTPADAETTDELLAVSGDGTAVLFASKASNLVAGVTDNNGDFDLFWRDLKAGTTKLITAQAGTLNALGFGTGATVVPLALRAVLSHDGQRVAYVSGAQAAAVTGDATVLDQLSTLDVFWWRADTGAARLVSIRSGQNAAVGNQPGIDAIDPNISDNGNTVAYGTILDGAAIDLSAALDNVNATYDIFVRTMDAADPTKATTAATRVPGKADLVGKFGAVDRPVGRYLSGDGRVVVYATTVGANIIIGVADQADTSDVFARDMTIATTAGTLLLSPAVSGAAIGNVAGQFALAPIVSRNGGTAVFVARAPGGSDDKQLVAGYISNGAPTELYARTLAFGPTPGNGAKLITAVSGTSEAGANGFLEQPAPGTPASYQVTADGKQVVFVSAATNLVDPSKDQNGVGLDVFVRDVALGLTEVVSVGRDGKTGTTPSERPSLSDDGRYVTFVSSASELGFGVTDLNTLTDIFLRDTEEGVTRAVSTAPDGLRTGDGPSTAVRVSSGGQAVLFISRAKNLTGTAFEKNTANLYQTVLPLDPLFGGGSKVVLASGPPDGQVRSYTIDENAKLIAVGGSFVPFPGTNTPARVAAGDVNGDGTADSITVVGPGGGSLLRLTDGATGEDLLPTVATYEPSFIGGLFVAAADLDSDGKAEIILSPDVGGGARIQVFSFNGSALIQKANFFGIDDPIFRGGARVAAGDINGDGKPEVIVGAGFGGGPRVVVYDGKTIFSAAIGTAPPKLFGDFFAFPGEDSTRLRNGVFVASGDVNGDGKSDLVFGGGPGGGPRIYVLDSALLTTGALDIAYGKPLANFFAFDSALRGGVRVTMKDLDGDGRSDIVAGSGEKSATQIRTYLSKNLPPNAAAEPAAFEVIDPFGLPNSPGGVFVG